MNEWFRERYIQRTEHEEIVAFYRKLVARLYGQVKEMRAAGSELEAINAIAQHDQHKAERKNRSAMQVDATGQDSNVIRVDFRPS